VYFHEILLRPVSARFFPFLAAPRQTLDKLFLRRNTDSVVKIHVAEVEMLIDMSN
jgi:hypothetical protein